MTIQEKEWFIEAPWGKLCVLVWGDCMYPPVLVCHGRLDSAATFRPLMKLLPKKFYYVGIELPGCGKSDPFPPGLMVSVYDLVYCIEIIVRHFRWESFIYLGHSMGCILGKLYDLSHPGKISRAIELDMIPNVMVVSAEKFAEWYKTFFIDFFDNYQIYNSKGTSPKYTREKAIEKLIKTRTITKEVAEETLERLSERTEDGLVRFTYDQRNKIITFPPTSKDQLAALFTNLATPCLAVVAEDTRKIIEDPFFYDESSYPLNNYRIRIVKGNHNVHANHPERVASYVSTFLLDGLKGLDSKSKI